LEAARRPVAIIPANARYLRDLVNRMLILPPIRKVSQLVTPLKRITIKQLHAETGIHVRRAARAPVEVTDHGKPVAIITGVSSRHREVFARIRTLRSRLTVGKDESVRDLINAGRRL
jgi:antitoxin (DNA-binding transcriptional repressor) of toxin-antitoxin stability system